MPYFWLCGQSGLLMVVLLSLWVYGFRDKKERKILINVEIGLCFRTKERL